MSVKTTRKELENTFACVNLTCIENEIREIVDGVFYTTGVYGWNSTGCIVEDAYSRYCVCYGYRSVPGIHPSKDLINKFLETYKEYKAKYDNDRDYEYFRINGRNALVELCRSAFTKKYNA